MPIEFLCPHCSKHLKVADEHAGKKASCPDCQGVAVVPGGAPPLEAPAPSPEARPENPYSGGQTAPPVKLPVSPPFANQGAGNPYAAPATFQPPPRKGYGSGSGPIRPTIADFGDFTKRGVELFRDNLGLMVLVGLVFAAVNIAIGQLQRYVVFEMLVSGASVDAARTMSRSIGFVGNIVTLFLGIGQVKICLQLARNQDASFGTLFSGGDRFLPVFGASFLFGIALLVGILLLILPGLVLLVLFWIYYYLVVDEKTGVFESFQVAFDCCKLNVVSTLLIGLMLFGMVVVLASVSFIFAVQNAAWIVILVSFVVITFLGPFISVIMTMAYLHYTGQE